MEPRDRAGSVAGEDGITFPIFERPPALIQFLDNAEEAIRSRLARRRLFERIFLLERDWMTRITMLMVILALFWGAVGGFDALGFQTQVVAYATQSPLHLSTMEIYSSVTLHGIREFFGFSQQLEMAMLGLLVVNALGVVPRHKWALYTSVGLVNASMLLLQGPVYLVPFNDNYFPAIGWYFLSPLGVAGHSAYVVSPLWFLGWLTLVAGVLLWAGWMVAMIRRWYRSWIGGAHRVPGGFPVFLWFVVGTLVLVPLTYVPVAIATIWDIGAAYAGWALDPLANQVIFWMFGHGIVYLLFLLPILALYLLIPILARRPLYSYRFSVVSAVLFVVLTPLLGIHHLYLTALPGWATWLTMAFSFAIVLPSAITFFSLWMTVKGVPAERWEWNAVALFALLSFSGAILGGLTGPVVATVPWDLDVHNSLFVLAHFHAITILSIVAGGYALVYAFFPILTGRRWVSCGLARGHFVATLVGGLLVVLMMDQLGSLGLLRREVILPLSPQMTLDQLLLFVGIVVVLLGQLLFVANGVLTVFRGALFSAPGLSFDEAVRSAAQSTAPRASPPVPIHEPPFRRQVPRARRERAEKIWAGVLVVLLTSVLVVATPGTLSVANGIAGTTPIPAGAEFVVADGQQYYWSVRESGPVNASFDNLIVAYAGQWVHLNLTASGATQSIYIPFRSQSVVNVQVVPGTTSYALFQAPAAPGVYGVPDGEYDGPWFGQDVAALVVLPAAEGPFANLSAFQASGGSGDLYDPPLRAAATADLVANGEGVFNSSVPGPTLFATVPAVGGPVAFRWTVPLASLGIDNYLVNVTSTDPNQQVDDVIAAHDTLPYPFGLYRLDPQDGLRPVATGPLRVDQPMVANAVLLPGAYVYGIATPVAYSYDPSGESGISAGEQTGLVMGLWGILWVS